MFKGTNDLKLTNFYKFIPAQSTSEGKISEGLGALVLMVYLGLKTKADSKNIIQISYQELADLLGVSRSGAQDAIYQLEKAELIMRMLPEYRTAIPIYWIKD